MVSVGGWLVLVGSAVFFAGAAYGVPRVFTTRSAEDRLSLLRSRAAAWRSAQWLYGAGPVLAALGVLALAAGWSGQAGFIAGASGLAMLVGAVLWSISCARRSRRLEEFAKGELPAGPWLGYVWLTLCGLAGLGLASLGFATWVGVLLLLSAATFAVAFVVLRDIPPFSFYLVLAVVGGWVLSADPH